MITTPRARGPVVAAVTAGLMAVGLLSSCGVAEDGTVAPGVAAEVGDTSISLDDVDEAADDLCQVRRRDEQTLGAAISGAELRARALQTLVLREVADGLAADYGIEPDPTFGQLEASARDTETYQALVTVGISYLVNVMRAVGAEEAGSGASDEEVLGAGIQAAQAWTEREGVTTSPVFPDLEIGDVAVEFARNDDLSVPVSQFAKDAVADSEQLAEPEADSAYAESLPESQRCGA